MTKPILLVEDDPVDRKFVVQALAEANASIDVQMAADGMAAMESLRERERPALIILDLNMPRMDGHSLLRALKQEPDLRKIPAVILSTAQSIENIESYHSPHACAHLIKPDTRAGYRTIAQKLHDFWRDACSRVH